MPPKKRNSYLGQFSENVKVLNGMEKKIQGQLLNIKQKEESYQNLINYETSLDLMSTLKHNKEQIDKSIEKEQQKLIYRERRLSELKEKNAALNLKNITKSNRLFNNAFSISSTKRNKRKLNPSSADTPHMAKVVRRSETLHACNAIHGGNVENITPTVTGMLDTLSSKCKSKVLADAILNGKQCVVQNIEQKVISSWSCNYYDSIENLHRSLNLFYSQDIMGKRKYLNTRKCNEDKQLPNYVPYKKLANFISSIDIGTVTDAQEKFGANLDGDDTGPGMYRPFDQYALRLVDFYLMVDRERHDKLLDFKTFKTKDPLSKLFVISIGGDGAPISGTVFLASFINIGKRIASSAENFLIFGANVSEDAKLVQRYVLNLISDIKHLESKTFTTTITEEEVKFEFRLGELPSDLKMLCFLAGELTSSAYYFSPFSNVNKNTVKCYNKNIGPGENDWQPISYKKRIDAVKLVELKKKELQKSKSNAKTKRTNLTSYMAKIGTRQEFVPLLSTYVDQAKAEPLHLKNNVCKEMFVKLLKVAGSLSKSRDPSYKDLNENDFLRKFIEFTRYNMGCTQLAKRLIKWYNESGGKLEGEFSYRFRGKESNVYLRKFPLLVQMMLQNLNTNATKVKSRINEIFYQSTLLRKVVSYSVRVVDFNKNILQKFESEASELFKACCILDQNVSPSLWTLCKAAPIHAAVTLKNYNLGLGVNTMEGREQKHQAIKRYSDKTTYQDRWGRIFRHEFIQMIYLREHGFDSKIYRKRHTSYLVEHSDSSCQKCGLKLESSICSICDGTTMKTIMKEIASISKVSK